MYKRQVRITANEGEAITNDIIYGSVSMQGIESGIEQNVCLGKLTLYGIGKTEE